MVHGLEVFRRYFRDFADRYVFIGGVAAEMLMTEAGLSFRATKDLDIVLLVEALDVPFATVFWQFVVDGGYAYRHAYEAQYAPSLYRFQKPAHPDYPFMIELFSRMPEGLDFRGEGHLTPLPIDDAVSSLSAILLDQVYYEFIRSGRRSADELTILGHDRLIPLKANAYLDMVKRKGEGADIDAKNIKKHRNDVLRLAQLLKPDAAIQLPARIHADLHHFLALIEQEKIDLESMRIKGIAQQALIDRIRRAFL